MARFLYYVPGLSAPVTSDGGYAELLKKYELANVLDGTSPVWRPADQGPDGHRGLVFIGKPPKSNAAEEIGYYPNRQQWFKCGEHWLGYWTDNMPAPADLKRDTPLDSRTMELGDGREWDLPIALYGAAGVALPQTFGLSPDGEPAQTVPARYRAFHEAAAWFYGVMTQAMADGALPQPDDDKCFDLALLALGHGYRVGEYEARALGLITTSNLGDICHVVIGYKTWREIIDLVDDAEKKSASADIPA